MILHSMQTRILNNIKLFSKTKKAALPFLDALKCICSSLASISIIHDPAFKAIDLNFKAKFIFSPDQKDRSNI